MDENATVTRAELAQHLLRSTSVGALRKGLRRHQSWATIYRGYRPQTLTRTRFMNRAAAFALDPERLNELVDLFLDDLGVANGPPEDRLRSAIDDSRIDGDTREAIATLVEANSLSAIPAGVGTLAPVPSAPMAGADKGNVIAPAPKPDSPPEHPSNASAVQLEKIDSVPVAPATPQPDGQTTLPFESFDWDAPADDVSEVQQAVTRFERSLVALLKERLATYHGQQWLERACGASLLGTLKARAGKRQAVSPETLLGYAEIGELLEIIVARRSWPAFAAIFDDKRFVEENVGHVIGLRSSGMHAGERSLYLTEQVAGLAAMVRLVRRYHAATADTIDAIYAETITSADDPADAATVFSRAITNLAEVRNPMLIGREAELRSLHEFWTDEFARVLSIVGPGGVGKTALLEAFIHERLSAPCCDDEKPNPEILVFLTAKDNWQAGMDRAPDSLRFDTLERVQEVTLSLLGAMPQDQEPEKIREDVLDMCQTVPILFALDNLESMDDLELDVIGTFLDDLPRPSKAILTTRDSRRVGRKLELHGLPESDSVDLLHEKLEAQGIECPAEDEATLAEIARATGGLPLLLNHCASVIALGCTPSEALARLRGDEFLRFLDFAFDSSVSILSHSALGLAYLLALNRAPVRRNAMRFLFAEEAELDEAIHRLGQLSFVDRTQQGKRVLFRLSTPQLREYLLKRAPELLAPELVSNIMRAARVGPAESESENVAVAIEQVVRDARETARRLGLSAAIDELQRGRARWGEDRRILATLGYFHFRNRNRSEARRLLEKSIAAGHESADTYTTLALVYYFDRQYDLAIARAETGLSLRPDDAQAKQVLSESLLGNAMAARFMITESQRRDLLRRALQHARESVIDDDISAWSRAHNDRSTDVAVRAERLLADYEPPN